MSKLWDYIKQLWSKYNSILFKALKVGAFIAISAFLTYLYNTISAVQVNSQLGMAVINVILVIIKGFISAATVAQSEE